MINSFHLEIKAPLSASSSGLLQGAGLLLQAGGMGLKRSFSQKPERAKLGLSPIYSSSHAHPSSTAQSPVLDGGLDGGGRRVGN